MREDRVPHARDRRRGGGPIRQGVGRGGLRDRAPRAVGDTEVDAHHTVEDTGIVLGQAFAQALGDMAGVPSTKGAL